MMNEYVPFKNMLEHPDLSSRFQSIPEVKRLMHDRDLENCHIALMRIVIKSDLSETEKTQLRNAIFKAFHEIREDREARKMEIWDMIQCLPCTHSDDPTKRCTFCIQFKTE